MLVGRRRRARAEAVELAEVKDNVRDDLVALGDDIRALDLDVQMPNADPAGEGGLRAAPSRPTTARTAVFETARTTRRIWRPPRPRRSRRAAMR